MNLSFPLEVSLLYHPGYGQAYGLTASEDHLYLAHDSWGPNQLVAMAIPSGDTLWRFNVPGSQAVMSFVPAVAGHRVLAGGQGGVGLYALDVTTGDSVWVLPIGSVFTRSPIISDGRVYQASPDSLNCVDLSSGQLVWTFVENIPQITAAADEEAVYFPSRQRIYALDKVIGDTLWHNASMPMSDFMSLALDSTNLYVSALRSIYALEKHTGNALWTVDLELNEWIQDWPSGIAIHPDFLIVKFRDNDQPGNHYLVLDKMTGVEVNRFTGIAEYTYSAPTIVNDYVVDYFDGELRFLHLPSGTLTYQLADIPVPWYPAQLVVADDKIYIAGLGPSVAVISSVGSSIATPSRQLHDLRLMPNPVRDQAILTFSLQQDTDIRLQILNADGRIMAEFPDAKGSAGLNHRPFNTGHVPTGLHYLRVFAGSENVSIPFVKTE